MKGEKYGRKEMTWKYKDMKEVRNMGEMKGGEAGDMKGDKYERKEMMWKQRDMKKGEKYGRNEGRVEAGRHEEQVRNMGEMKGGKGKKT